MDGVQNLFEVDKHTLSQFTTKIGSVFAFGDDADLGFEKLIEVSGFGPVLTAALGAFDFIVFDDFIQLFQRFAFDITDVGKLIFYQMIGPGAVVTGKTIDHGVGEIGSMAGSFPNFWAHENGGIQTKHIRTGSNEGLPPKVGEVSF